MDDVTQHSNKQLSTILRNPSHPLHSAAKAERDRRMAKRESNDLDEINLKDLTKTIAKSTGTKNLQKALKKSKDQTKMDLAALRKKLQAEKTLTPAEIKKREEIAKAMERDNPDMPMAKKMAIATATAKKVAEDVELDEAKIISRKPHPDGGHIVKLKTDGGQTVTRHLKNGKVKTMKVHNESVELDEDVTHQTVKPPNHTKKYSGDAHAFGAGKNKPKVVTSSQADAHDKTADHHRTVADAHRAASKKTSSMKLKYLHNTAANAHDKAAEAHNDASHSSDGSLTKTAGHMSRAYHSTMSANDASKRARNLGTKTKRMKEEVELDEGAKEKALKALMTKALGGKRAKPGYTSAVANNGDFVVKDGGGRIVGRIKSGDYTNPLKEETLEENRVDALAKDFHNRLKKAGNSDRNQSRERYTTLAKAKKQGLSPIEIKQLDGKMNAIMNKMDESVDLDEVLDTPQARQSYRDKNKRSKEKAASSAVAKMVRSKDDDNRYHPAAELKTIAKRTRGDDLEKRGAARKTRAMLMKKEENIEEKAPKIKDDFLKKERERNRAHDAAMGRTATGRKKPVRQMTSTQKSLADIRKRAEK